MFHVFLCIRYNLDYLKQNKNHLVIVRTIKKMSANEIRDFIFKNYYKRVGVFKENSHYSMKRLKKKDLLLLANKLIEKIPDPQNSKEHCQSFIRKKDTKSAKQSKIITYQPKTFENPNVVIKSIITEQNIQKLHVKVKIFQTKKM